MAQPGAVSRVILAVSWLALGAAMVAVPVWLGWTRWSVILSGHPITLTVTILCALAGVVAVAWAIATLLLGSRYDVEIAPGQPGHRTPAQIRRRARWRVGLAIPALVICLFTVSLLAWSRPFAASAVALDAMRSGDNVRVSDRFTWFEMQSVRRNTAGREIRPTVGLIFHPGARVDSRAYAHLFKPLANAGYLVVVLKAPFGVALTNVNHPESVMKVHPHIASWAVGGHSLGGVAAASFANGHSSTVKGLLLYASYPSSRIERTDLKVLSVSGANDGLATPADLERSKPDLPPQTQYVVVKGGVHAFFGDYGDQPGDGTPGVERAVAQAQTVKTTQAFLLSLTPPAKKR